MCALALVCATANASARELVQTKTRVRGFELSRAQSVGHHERVSLERHPGFPRLQLQPCVRPAPLWSWPGQNPYRWRDPSGRIGFDGQSTDRATGSPQDWGDPAFGKGAAAGAGAGALGALAALSGSLEAGVAGLITRALASPSAIARWAGIGASASIATAKGCAEAPTSSAPVNVSPMVAELRALGPVPGFQVHHLLPEYLGKMLGYTTQQMAEHPGTFVSQWSHTGAANPAAIHKAIAQYLPPMANGSRATYSAAEIREGLQRAYADLGRSDLFGAIEHLIP